MNEEPNIEENKIEEDFHNKWNAGVGHEVRVKYDEYQFKTSDKGRLVEIISINHARVIFEPEKKGGIFHMDNLKEWKCE